MQLSILFEDDYLIAVDKPSGLLVHPSWISKPDEPTLMGLLKEHYQSDKLHTIHRLDRATSGVMLVGKELESSKTMQEQFQARGVKKEYECLVRGWFSEPQGRIDHALVPKYDKYADPLASQDKEAKEAVTDFEVIAQTELDIPVGRYSTSRYSLVACFPHTGRKHQIRRHMKHHLHPIIGDTKYGEGRHNRMFRDHFNLHRLVLMARSIQFSHPVTDELMTIHADLPVDIERLYEAIGLNKS
ncbi:tRNA pseudouridine synthase C [Marinobacterium sp. xm-a-121]|uniref:RluA family pseudouridine synthase n=1 Tax=unclassified Marinobacterium TaxID=2644139 RepID=UPI0015683679|nr:MULTISPECIES: RluA family pseudouridine synthase [unclassified Marinobacterium]NRP39632.1 tRNA pseudouridine synthase C [Marinobacterium sp. xm-a-121]NRP94062.1 tRNA pseudouridine synthase C [Marinobacterium sp. xm-g-59]NRQ00182.1 tRNA pseudouridine synthase C [Marinobacterium sp. xm-v-233]